MARLPFGLHFAQNKANPIIGHKHGYRIRSAVRHPFRPLDLKITNPRNTFKKLAQLANRTDLGVQGSRCGL